MSTSAELKASLFVVDEPGLKRNAALIQRLGAAHVLVDRLNSDDLTGQDVIAVDVDVTVIPIVRQLRSVLKARNDDVFRIFAIDTARRLENIHASIVGASDIVRRPFNLKELEARLAAFRARGKGESTVADASIVSAASAVGEMFDALTSGRAVNMSSVMEASDEVVDAITEVGLPSWVDSVRSHHQGTFQHCLIITGLACSFGRSAGMSRRDVMTLTTAGMLHDIGKANIPLEILDKPGKLNDAEVEIMKTHTVLGHAHLLRHAEVDSDVLAAVRSHHEYLNGSGYPDGLSGQDIGDLTRILTICDVFGAMIERRAYREPVPTADALAVLDKMSDEGKLEMALVRAFHAAA